MSGCWDADAQNRPSFKALKESLSEINTPAEKSTMLPPPMLPPPISMAIEQHWSCYRVLSSSRRRPEPSPKEQAPQEVESATQQAIEVVEEDVNTGSSDLNTGTRDN